MNFTGERFIPGEGGCQIAYEHLHRYFFALRWAESARVLDLACGNGYGAALLARRARHVWALDIDAEAIAGAHNRWQSPNLTFLRGDATQLPLPDGSIDLVVAMEALEHLDNQDLLLKEIARVCSDKGVALISTPNKAEYSDARNYKNPFHKKELYLEEFVQILRQYFLFVEIAGQQIRAGSLISHNASDRLGEVFEEPVGGKDKVKVEPMYYLAVCSPNKLHSPIPSHSAFLDSVDGLILGEKEEIFRLGEWGKSLENVIGEKDRTIRELQRRMEEEVKARDQNICKLQDNLLREVDLRDLAIRELQARMEQEKEQKDKAICDLQESRAREIEHRDQTILSLQEELQTEISDRDRRIADLLSLLHLKEKEFDERGKWGLSLQAEVESLRGEVGRLSRMRQALLYRILSRIGLLPK
jgi:SAM-dependent methyltransferase